MMGHDPKLASILVRMLISHERKHLGYYLKMADILVKTLARYELMYLGRRLAIEDVPVLYCLGWNLFSFIMCNQLALGAE